jgi:hypothetical protein
MKGASRSSSFLRQEAASTPAMFDQQCVGAGAVLSSKQPRPTIISEQRWSLAAGGSSFAARFCAHRLLLPGVRQDFTRLRRPGVGSAARRAESQRDRGSTKVRTAAAGPACPDRSEDSPPMLHPVKLVDHHLSVLCSSLMRVDGRDQGHWQPCGSLRQEGQGRLEARGWGSSGLRHKRDVEQDGPTDSVPGSRAQRVGLDGGTARARLFAWPPTGRSRTRCPRY